jgi:hypothetical protein
MRSVLITVVFLALYQLLLVIISLIEKAPNVCRLFTADFTLQCATIF